MRAVTVPADSAVAIVAENPISVGSRLPVETPDEPTHTFSSLTEQTTDMVYRKELERALVATRTAASVLRNNGLPKGPSLRESTFPVLTQVAGFTPSHNAASPDVEVPKRFPAETLGATSVVSGWLVSFSRCREIFTAREPGVVHGTR